MQMTFDPSVLFAYLPWRIVRWEDSGEREYILVDLLHVWCVYACLCDLCISFYSMCWVSVCVHVFIMWS